MQGQICISVSVHRVIIKYWPHFCLLAVHNCSKICLFCRNRDFDYLFDHKWHLVSVGLYDLVLERHAVLAVKSYNAVRLSGPVVWFPETYQLLDR